MACLAAREREFAAKDEIVSERDLHVVQGVVARRARLLIDLRLEAHGGILCEDVLRGERPFVTRHEIRQIVAKFFVAFGMEVVQREPYGGILRFAAAEKLRDRLAREEIPA